MKVGNQTVPSAGTRSRLMTEEQRRAFAALNSKEPEIDPEVADEILRDGDDYLPPNDLGGGAADALSRSLADTPMSPDRIIAIAAMVCAISGFFFFAVFFIPPAVVLGVIAIFRKQFMLGVMSLGISVIAAFTSSTFLALLGLV